MRLWQKAAGGSRGAAVRAAGVLALMLVVPAAARAERVSVAFSGTLNELSGLPANYWNATTPFSGSVTYDTADQSVYVDDTDPQRGVVTWYPWREVSLVVGGLTATAPSPLVFGNQCGVATSCPTDGGIQEYFRISFAGFSFTFADGTVWTLTPNASAWFCGSLEPRQFVLSNDSLPSSAVLRQVNRELRLGISSESGTNYATGPFQVTITGEAADTTAPAVSEVMVTPQVLWPANNKLVKVLVMATATDAGSGVASVQVKVTDSYGQLNQTVTMSAVGNGGYAGTVKLLAARNGKDKAGRTYTLSITATDQAGNTSAPVTATVVVPHDMGK